MVSGKNVTLVFLEYPVDAYTYLRQRDSDRPTFERDIVIALTPTIHPILNAVGIPFQDTLPYFSNEAHERAVRKVAGIVSWIDRHFDYSDSHDVHLAYGDRIARDIKRVVNYCLWSIEILDAATLKHRPRHIRVYRRISVDPPELFMQAWDDRFASIAYEYSREHGLEIETVPTEGRLDLLGYYAKRTFLSVIDRSKDFIALLVSLPFLSRPKISSLAGCVVFTTTNYNMNRFVASSAPHLAGRATR